MTTGIPPLRKWQKVARDEVMLAWRTNASSKILIAACPAAGKTIFTATIINDLLHEAEINLAIVLAPTTNIQLLWVRELKAFGMKATADASNAILRYRKNNDMSMIEDKHVLVLTYAQLSNDSELIAELARRTGRVLLIGDEIHHADDDESYGEAVQKLADECTRTFALSGTPFNSSGGALALCDHEIDVDVNGKPIRRTLTTYAYNYGSAILDLVCRPVEFIKVYGKGEATYRRLSNDEIFKRITDLARQRKSDRLSILLDTDGEFMQECACQAIRSLADLRSAGDRKAAMLVVAKNKEHGARLTQLLKRTCETEKQSFIIQEIYNDTPKAHERIEDLRTDSTDIIISVRMISEGVDIKRLRVGFFATDWMTRMFFIQFIGRFVRTEERLDKKTQFARVIIPAHVSLLEYAREIEQMVESAVLIEDGECEGEVVKKEESELVQVTTKAGAQGIVYRGEEFEERELAEALYRVCPSARGNIPEGLAIKMAKDMHLGGSNHNDKHEQEIDWSNRNDMLVRAVVSRLKANGQSDDELYGRVQAKANSVVGIQKKDKMTAEETLIKRHAFLQLWLKRLIHGQDEENAT